MSTALDIQTSICCRLGRWHRGGSVVGILRGGDMRAQSLLIAVAVLGASSVALARTGYYQFPDLHDHAVVFAAEGDLWTVADTGGTARRLTSHAGSEYFPRYSPDGKWIAFTGEYGGNRDVYVIPADGGEPRRLTWHPDPDEVIDWMPDGKSIMFRTTAANNTPSGFEWHLFTVPVAGGEPEPLPLGFAGRAAIDPVSRRWAFNRSSVEFRTWKRYRGGTAPSIWVGDPQKREFREVTKIPGAAAFPMWSGGRVFFLSDQGGTANLWSMTGEGAELRRETQEAEWDVRWPSVGPDGRIVFSLAGDLAIYQPTSGKTQRIAIDIPSERPLARVRYPNPEKAVTSFELSPDGERLAVVTRGEVFSVAVKDGVTLPITRGSAARERGASFSGDGKSLIYLSDASGEEDVRTIDAWGRGQARIVKPAGKSGWNFPPIASPDGKWLAYADQTQTLYVVASAGGPPRAVDHSAQSEINEYAWSPDGRYLAYSLALATDYSSIRLFDTQTGKLIAVTGPTTNDFAPAWDPEGRYLYFLSDRAANPVMDRRDEENVEIRTTRPFLVLLARDGVNPFANTSGMPPRPGDAAAAAEAKPDARAAKPTGPARVIRPVRIDPDGLADRYVAFPVPAASYAQLAATSKTVFYLSLPVRGIAELQDDGQPQDGQLIAFDLERRKPKPFLDEVTRFRVAGDKLAIQKKAELFVLDAAKPPAPEELGDHKVGLSSMVVELVPQDEWRQIFDETWRMMRDFYWDASMGGVDWKAQRDKYRALLPRLGTRSELNDLLGELIAELATSHTYIRGGDPGVEMPQITTGLLGIDAVRRATGFEVTRIYRGDPVDGVRSPLDEPGVNVAVGSVITAVNHRPFAAGEPLLAAFENLAGKEVVLSIAAGPGAARDVVVHPLGSERRLRYVDWVRRNREYVAQKTGGKVGYIHLPDMGVDGLIAFDTWFYPQINKQALVVDVRWNRGGFISQRILERMRRKVIAVFHARGGSTSTYPVRSVDGPFVVLTNEYAGSDGDIFPTVVQLDKLAPVIGMRSWGGVVGIRGDKPLVDGGMPTQPEFAFWDPTHRWGTENRGVIPDIEVQNLPQDVARSVDAQLDRGLTEVQHLLAQHPPPQRDFGGVPDRSRKAFAKREP
jgi:tricorn protease